MGAEITERTVAQEKRRNGERTEKTEKLKRLIEDELSSPFDLRYSVSPVSPCPPHPPFPREPAIGNQHSPMQIARVIGTVVSTEKHPTLEGAKLLLVQPLNMDDTLRGSALLAVDTLGAGVHE